MSVPVSPSIEGYLIGKGKVYFMREGESPAVWRDMGNAPTFELTPKLTKLEHFSSREGVKVKDKTVVVEKAMELKLVLDEWTADNLALALLGTVTDTVSPSGGKQIDIFSGNSVAGKIKCVGTNEVGPAWTYELNRVEFIPDKALGAISDEWGQIELTGDVTAVEGLGFGTATCTG
jgi:hypothetical protein